MNKIFIALVVALVLGGLAYFTFNQTAAPASTPELNTYTNEAYGLTFAYPHYYEVGEHGSSLVLTDARLPEPPAGGEGPTAITINIYPRQPAAQTVEDWVKNSPNSNYQLSPDGALESFDFSGAPALSYAWDGLYRGETVAVAKGDYLYAFSVTALTPADEIRRDFYRLLETVQFN